MISLVFRTTQFIAYHLLISTVDRISRLPRNSNPSEVMRLLRKNIVLKEQVRALVLELKAEKGSRPRVLMRTRAAQVFAYMLTRGGMRRNAVHVPLCFPNRGPCAASAEKTAASPIACS